MSDTNARPDPNAQSDPNDGEHRRAESEERFQLAVAGSSDGIWDWDIENDRMFFSRRFKELIGFGEDEFPDRIEAWAERIHPDDRQAAEEALRAHFKERDRPYALEYRVRHKDGHYRWFLARGQAVWGPDGTAVRMAGSLTDITKSRSDRIALEKALGTQEAILDATPYGIIALDLSGVIRSMNRGASRMLQLDEAAVVGVETPAAFLHPAQLETLTAELKEELGDALDTPMEALLHRPRRAPVHEEEWTFHRADGTSFPAALSIAPVREANEGVTGFVTVFTDLTERKAADRLKDEFVSTVSHELRTPLTSISGALSLLMKGVAGELSEQAGALVEMAHRNSERLILLINDILDMERISAGEMRFDFQVQELMPLVNQALEATAPYGEKFDVTFEVGSRLEGARVDVDAHRFGQVMANLLSNAAKFSPGGATVAVHVRRTDDGIRISVEDQGDGIPEEFQDRIFRKFSQADGSAVRRLGGTGLGLAITKAIVEKMNGQIHFETAPGEGTTFHVDLPEWSTSNLAHVAHAVGGGRRILIVEDDPEAAQVFKVMLAEQGLTPRIAPDGETALRMIREEDFDAVTLDLALPDIDGLDLLAQLRQDEKTRSIPVVVISANAEQGRARAVRGLAVVAWLQKPIRSEDLAEALQVAGIPAGRPARILHVEDDDSLASVISHSGSDLWSFEWAGTVRQARRKLSDAPFDLVLLDLGLPDGSGWELLDAIRKNDGDPRVIVFSAAEVDSDRAEGVAQTVVKARSSPEELLRAIRRVLAERKDAPGRED